MINELDFNDKSTIDKIKLFLKKNANSEYNQSIEWNNIRNEKVKYFLYYTDSEQHILWTCSLFEKNRENQSYLYAPRGPVLDFNNTNLIKLFLDEIYKWMKLKKYSRLIMNPIIDFKMLENFPKEYIYKLTKRNDYLNLHDSCKLAIMDTNLNEDDLINKLPSKFRQNTRRSYRKGLISKISTEIDFNTFYQLYIETAIRHGFNPHDLTYFKNIYNEFKNNLIFLEVWYKDIPLAMSIDIIYNDKLIYLYGVSSTNNRNLLGMYNLQWEAIKYCIKNNISKYDFGGVFCEEDDVENKDYGLYNFKKGYCYNGFIDIVPDIIFDFEEVFYD